MIAARIVGFTSLNLDKLLPVTEKLLGKNVATFADSKRLLPPLHHLQCLASIRDLEDKSCGANVQQVAHFMQAVVLIACDNRDSATLLSYLNMPCILVPTINRDFDYILVFGNLDEWRMALITGGGKYIPPQLRQLFNVVHAQFCEHGLQDVFGIIPTKSVKDPVTYLEYKP